MKGAIVIITKKLFVETMNKLKIYDEKMDMVDEALRILDRNFGGLYITEPFEVVFPILSEIFDDKESDWLGYLAFELNWLTKYNPGDVTDENGNEIDLSTWDKVYDFLIKEMEAND